MKAPKIAVDLTTRQAALVDRALGVGRYSSLEEIVRDALGLWEQRETRRQLALARLKRAYHEGVASGEGRALDAGKLLAELKSSGQFSVS